MNSRQRTISAGLRQSQGVERKSDGNQARTKEQKENSIDGCERQNRNPQALHTLSEWIAKTSDLPATRSGTRSSLDQHVVRSRCRLIRNDAPFRRLSVGVSRGDRQRTGRAEARKRQLVTPTRWTPSKTKQALPARTTPLLPMVRRRNGPKLSGESRARGQQRGDSDPREKSRKRSEYRWRSSQRRRDYKSRPRRTWTDVRLLKALSSPRCSTSSDASGHVPARIRNSSALTTGRTTLPPSARFNSTSP